MADELLREMIRSEFGHVNQRLDAMCDLQQERHTDVKAKLAAIEADVKQGSRDTSQNTAAIGAMNRDIKTLFGRAGSERARLTFYATLIVAGGWLVYEVLRVTGVAK